MDILALALEWIRQNPMRALACLAVASVVIGLLCSGDDAFGWADGDGDGGGD